jgi:ABC-type multidrug transport system fused ATPase/permease subunit
MFGAAISCNLNVYRLCEKIPIDHEYLMNEGQLLLRGLWGGLVGKSTAVALILSALTNVPIIIYSGGMSLFLNLAIALVLTILIFIVPHYMFHRLLERAKEEMLSKVLSIRKKFSLDSIEDLGRGTDDQRSVGDMLELIYLTQYEGDLTSRSTWLFDLEVVVELLVVGSIHVIFMEILTMLTQH